MDEMDLRGPAAVLNLSDWRMVLVIIIVIAAQVDDVLNLFITPFPLIYKIWEWDNLKFVD